MTGNKIDIDFMRSPYSDQTIIFSIRYWLHNYVVHILTRLLYLPILPFLPKRTYTSYAITCTFVICKGNDMYKPRWFVSKVKHVRLRYILESTIFFSHLYWTLFTHTQTHIQNKDKIHSCVCVMSMAFVDILFLTDYNWLWYTCFCFF